MARSERTPCLGAAALLAALAVAVALTGRSAAAAATQAGCPCLAEWKDAAGGTHSGCANPNDDPLGDWCAVDAEACPGYYGSFAGEAATKGYFDYCGADVRERTVGGCLCQSSWRLEGIGKLAYADRCARPDGGEDRKCVVSARTCPEAKSPDPLDACHPLPEAAAAATAAGEGANATAAGCACVGGGWCFDRPAAAGGGRLQLAGCANPDGDVLGAWCPVDPHKCGEFDGYADLDASAANQVAFGYCGHESPVAARAAGCRGAAIAEWGQCGGKSACGGWGCADAAWAGACCATGLECRRLHEFYWQCAKAGAAPPPMTDRAAAAGGGGGGGGATTGAADDSSTDTQQQTPPAAAAGDEAATPAAAAPADASAATVTEQPPAQDAAPSPPAGGLSLPALEAGLAVMQQAKAPGDAVSVLLRVSHAYHTLRDDAGAQARFKADVVAWLKAAAGAPELVHSAGIASISQGSVVAEGAVVLAAGAPAGTAADVAKRLQDGAAASYEAAGLASSWGSLMSFQASPAPLRATRLAEGLILTPEDVPRGAVRAAGDGGRLRLSAGAIAGVVVGAAAVVGLAAFVVHQGLAMNRGRDASKSAQLAYMNEMTEADMVAAEEEEAEEAAAKGKKAGAKVRRRFGGWGMLAGMEDPHVAWQKQAAAEMVPTSLNATSTGGAASPEPHPDAAFLPLPDGEAARYASAAGGIAFASLKQRRISGSQGGAVSQSGSPLARASGAYAGSGSSYFGSALSKLGSSVASYVSSGGALPEAAAAAAAAAAGEKDS
ncbi:MAG: hypothetical protein J3K34DRAFT_503160 [Monoraphidium minutum]|nr:MAG: hypothetical protein J3K34DRAFT_503160 [Monoraphidium minutum]